MHTSPYSSLAGLLFFLCGLLACEPIEVDNSDQNFPLSLTLSADEDSLRVTWDEVNVSDFNRYFLFVSGDSIESLNPSLGVNGFMVFSADEVKENRFSQALTSVILARKVYYRVYASIGDRFLVSPTAVFERDLRVIEGYDFGFSGESFVDQSSRKIYSQTSTTQLVEYDWDEDTATLFRNGFPFNPILDIRFQTYNGTKEIGILPFSSSQLNIYNQETGQLIESIPTSGGRIMSFDFLGDWVIIADNDFDAPLKVYDRNSQQVISGFGELNYFEDRKIDVLSVSDRLFLEAGDNQVYTYRLSTDGVLLNTNSINTGGVISTSYRKNFISPDGRYFIPYSRYKLIRTDLSESRDLPIDLQQNIYAHLTFSIDGSTLLGFNSSASSGRIVEEISVPDLSVMNSTEVPFFVRGLFRFEDEIIMQTSNNQGEIIFVPFN